MSTVLDGHRYDGAIMLTASHLPSNRNGLKFFTAKGGLESADITAILAGAAKREAVWRTRSIERCLGHELIVGVPRPCTAPTSAGDAGGDH